MIDYTETEVVDYNDDPAPDDGTAVTANKITWAGIKSEFFDPLNTAIASIDTEVDTSIASIPLLIGKQTLFLSVDDITSTGATSSYAISGSRVTYSPLTNSSTTPSIWAALTMSRNWDFGNITVRPWLVNYNGGTGTGVVLDHSALFVLDGESIGGTYGAISTLSGSIGSISSIWSPSTPISVAIGGTPGVDGLLIINVTRDYGHVNDTYSTTVGLLGLEIGYNTLHVVDNFDEE